MSQTSTSPAAANDAVKVSQRPPGALRTGWRKFSRNKFAIVGLVVLFVFVVLAILAHWIAPYDPGKVDMMSPNLKPGTGNHLLGTDDLGRDIFSRLLYSSQVSLSVGFLVAIASVILGTIVGAVSGYFGGWIDTIFMRLVDVLNSIPLLFLNILVLAIFGTDFKYMILILTFTGWMSVARLVRGTYLQLREMQYVEAAKAIGVSSWGIIIRHLMRNSTAPIIVNATLMVGSAILSESALSYLGLGVQEPQTSWGRMLSNSQQYMLVDPWLAVYPGLCILIVVLAVNFVGDGIRDAMDPRKKAMMSGRRFEQWRKSFSKSKI